MIYPLLILAHIIADFPFQTNELIINKQVHLSALLKHLLIVFFTSFVLSLYYFSVDLFLFILGITLFHGIIDYCKIYLTQKLEQQGEQGEKNYKLELFLVDQILHIFIILLFVPLISLEENLYFASMYDRYKDIFVWLQVFNENRIGFIAIVVSVTIFNFKGSTIITRATLEKYKSDIGTGDKGTAIGNLERLLILLFIVLGNYSLIGFVFTAKSLIRFKEIEEGETEEGFVEYYLIGSITSIFLAVLTGSVINIYKYLW